MEKYYCGGIRMAMRLIKHRVTGFFDKWTQPPLSPQIPLLLTPHHSPPLTHDTKRKIDEAINVYFLLLNADIKFRRFIENIGLDKLYPEMRAIAKQTMHIVELIYTHPVRSESCMAVAATACGEYSLQPRPQDAGWILPKETPSLRWKLKVALGQVGEEVILDYSLA
jgi:hypothetical protein